jgi:cephalosporin-C deacetylase-like acetyl esterase
MLSGGAFLCPGFYSTPMKSFFVLLFVVASISVDAFSQSKKVGRLNSEFEYDSNLPLELVIIGDKVQDGVNILDLTYASLKGGPVTAFLVTPVKQGKFAGVIFFHPGPGNRFTFLDEAISLAHNGVVSLLIDAPFRRPEPWRRTINPPHDPENEREMYIQTVLDLRRGIDLLLSRKEVDAKRIGYVGHSFGATWGGVLAGIEKRISAFVLIAGRPSLTDWIRTTEDPNVVRARTSIPPEKLRSYLEKLAPLDSVRYIPLAKRESLFFQFALQDENVLESEAKTIIPFVDKSNSIKWYEADHQSVRNHKQAMADRTAWLGRRLRLGIIPKNF